MTAAAEVGRDLNVEWRANTADGSARWLLSYGSPERDDGGRVVRYLGVVIDITERRQAEQELAAREAEAREVVRRLSRAQQLGHTGDWEWDVVSGEVRWSEEVYLAAPRCRPGLRDHVRGDHAHDAS